MSIASITAVVLAFNSNEQHAVSWANSVMPIIGWAIFWLLILMIRLRSVVVPADGLTIKSFKNEKKIDFKNIEWVYQIAMINPTLLSLKYKDLDTDRTKKILVIPDEIANISGFNFLKEAQMTKFIREQVIKNNINYQKENVPSRWLTFGLILGTMIPIIIVFYLNWVYS